jgi:phage protein D
MVEILTREYPYLAPTFRIEVAGYGDLESTHRLITHVEYESADGLADVARLRISNPDRVISDSKILQPGNEFSLFGGYAGQTLKHLGRVLIIRNVPNFPQDAEPTMAVVGYTKDCLMMDNEPKKSKDRVYPDQNWHDIVAKKAKEYDFTPDIDEVPGKAVSWVKGKGTKGPIQKAGMNDYEFVQGIANIKGFVFWVDGDKDGKWTLHFKDPEKMKEQETKYLFKYDFYNNSSLLSFTPELLIKGAKTNIAVVVKDDTTGTVIKATIEEDNQDAPDMSAFWAAESKMDKEYPSSTSIRLAFDSYSFDVVTSKKFKAEADVVSWATQWFRRMRQNFILSKGKIVGTEDLMARQIHGIDGVGIGYSGDYYFHKVRHIFDNSAGYMCDIGCRKVVED